ncbi:hypothetical protein E2K59_21180, partial [Escherichia coli]
MGTFATGNGNDLITQLMQQRPIKVTLLTPGMEKDGTMSDFGIPASIVAKYLDEHG